MTTPALSEQEIYEKAVELVEKTRGKLEVTLKVAIRNMDELSMAYTPGVAEPTRRVHKDKSLQYRYTARGSQVAVITDGSAVLGLGNIGPEAAHVVMEGKAAMLKVFAGADAFPLCLSTQNSEEIILTAKAVAPSFSMIFLEDIAAPRCFQIEERLEKELDIPVFHDDQHGTAIAVCAGLINSLKLVHKTLQESTIVINGPGAAGIATAKLLFALGAQHITLCDRTGAIYAGRTEGMNPWKVQLATQTNRHSHKTLAESLCGADVFIGLSAPGVVTPAMVSSMNRDAIVLAMANPVPEIMPDAALAAGACIVGTGRSDFPNMVNNLLAFPGIVRGTLNARATKVNEAMKLAAVHAIANFVPPAELSPLNILPNPLSSALAQAVTEAVEHSARQSGVARA
ncbi:NAD(P)-dependent malic enzyme [Desulfovibrio cuneatus]|uniref:NAD(P)-dependent malic enzyme n=1 Tax=Desulfovibrio cuneatus TaxID=159728 RepID=UPI0004212D2F|nr:NADP-dependent malic enzyme [Desulfovibrio cuneatus]